MSWHFASHGFELQIILIEKMCFWYSYKPICLQLYKKERKVWEVEILGSSLYLIMMNDYLHQQKAMNSIVPPKLPDQLLSVRYWDYIDRNGVTFWEGVGGYEWGPMVKIGRPSKCVYSIQNMKDTIPDWWRKKTWIEFFYQISRSIFLGILHWYFFQIK